MLKAVWKKYWKILFSMILTSVLGAGILTGLTGSFISLEKNLAQYIEEYNYPDAVITTEVIPNRKTDVLLKIEGVESFDTRLAADSVLESPDGTILSIRAFSFQPDDRQKMHVWSGRIPDGSSDELLAEVLFAETNGLKTGDAVRIRVGDEFRTFTIAGLISMPEDLSVRENKYSLGLNTDFGYLYVPLSVLEKESDAEHQRIEKEIAEKEAELKKARVDAESIYLDALEQLASGREELQAKIREFRSVKLEMEKTALELEEKEKELLEQQADVLAKKAELEAKKEEALAKQKELRELKEQAESLLDEIKDALREADKKEEELLALKEEAEKKKEELLTQRAGIEEAIQKLQEAKEALKEIDEGLEEAEPAYEKLTEKNVIRAVSLLRLLNRKIKVSWLSDSAKAILRFVECCKKYGIVIDIDKPICTGAAKILKVIDEIEADEKILTEENAEDLVKRAAQGDQSAIESEEYKKIVESVKHYTVIDDIEEAYEKALEIIEELLEPVRETDFPDLLEDIESLFGKNVKEFISYLREKRDILKSSGIEQILAGESPEEAADALESIIDTWKTCGNDFDETISLTDGIHDLNAVFTQMEADYAFFEREEEIPSEEMMGRYLQEAEVISERRYEIARERCSWLYRLIQKYHLREIMERIDYYTSWTVREALEETAKLREYADELEEYTGEEITTVGEFLDAYDKTAKELKELIEELKDKRKEIIRQLEEAGVEEDEIDEAIEKAEDGKKQIDDGLAYIENGLKEIEDGLNLIQEKRREADQAIGMIEDALAEIDDGLRQIAEGLLEAIPLEEAIRSGLNQIEEGLDKIRGGKREITEGLQESEAIINEASYTLKTKESEAEEEWAKQLKEFEHLEEEIDHAWQELLDSEGYEDLCNQIQITFKEGADPKETLKKCEAALGDIEIKESYDFEDSDVNRRIHANTDPIRRLARFVPVVFYIVVITVVFLFMSILVRMCRREIGIYMALGFSRGRIRLLFCGIGLAVALCSYIPGLGVGWILIRLISGYFRDFFPLPFVVAQFDVSMLAPDLLLTILAVQVSTLAGTSLISRIQPSEAMTRSVEAPPSVPKILDLLLRPAGELKKYSIVSLLRNPLRFLLTVLCISATSILIYSSMSFLTSKEAIVHQLMDLRIHYDCEVFVEEGKEKEFLEKLNGLDYIEGAEKSQIYFRDVSFGDTTKSLMISSLIQNSSMVGIVDSNQKHLPLPETGIVLDRYTAESLGAGVGDTVMIDGVPVSVSALSDQYISRIQYVPESQAEVLGDESIGSVLVRLPDEKKDEFRRYLAEQEGYLYSIYTDSLKNGLISLYETYDLYAWILVGFAVVIGLLIVLNITATTLLEQKKELCVLRTLGFSLGEIGRNLFSQSVLRLLCSLIIGIPIGGMIAEYSLSAITTSDRLFPYVSGIKEILCTFAIVLIYIVLSHILSVRRMAAWNIVEEVKDRE